MLYSFDIDTPNDLCKTLACNAKRRRLELNLSRKALSAMSNVPVATITKWEQQYSISLKSFVAIAKSLGYSNDIKALLSQPQYSTMEELESINRNKNRKRGSNEVTNGCQDIIKKTLA